jgi:hypothetical protein
MPSERRRSSEAAEPSKKRAGFDGPSKEDDLPPYHQAKASGVSDIEEETIVHASPAPEPSSRDHVSSHEDDEEPIHDDDIESNHDNDVVASHSDHASSSSSEQETPEDDLTRRLRAAIDYTTARLAAGLKVELMTRFYVPSSPPHPTLTFLRPLSDEPGRGGTSIAHFIYADAVEEVYELGMPGPVQQDGVDPRWFHGRSRAEVRAGPFTEPADVRAVARVLRGIETRATNAARANGGRTNKQAAIDDKLAEGLRRQEAGEWMHDSSSEGDEVPERRQDFDDHEDDDSATGPSSSGFHSDDDALAPRPRAVRFVIESSPDSSNEVPAPQPRACPIVESSSDSSNEVPAPRSRVRPIVESSSDSSNKVLAPRSRARPIVESSSNSSNEVPAPRSRALPIIESSSDSSDKVPAPRPRGAHPVIESSSPDDDEESYVVGRC